MFSKRSLLIAAIAVLGFGGIAAGCNNTASTGNDNTVAQTNSSSNSAGTSNAESDLRVGLTQLLGQHVDLAAAAARAGFDGRAKDFEASAKSLDNNSVALSKAIGSVYGPQAETQFLAIWRSHIGFVVDYTVAAKSGDKAGQDKAVQNLMGYVEGVSDFLSKANPNLPRETLKSVITEHVLQLKATVDAYGAGDLAKSYAEQEMAYMHMGDVATTLAAAIAKQFPEKF
ncbi:MAG: hypothetical protein M3Q64_02475 [bacterium]|nr:hypothetical protein [bacterium]